MIKIEYQHATMEVEEAVHYIVNTSPDYSAGQVETVKAKQDVLAKLLHVLHRDKILDKVDLSNILNWKVEE